MLVFGESILNDAVAIVLTNVIVGSKRQILSLNTTKLTTYSMIGLLASSNLTSTTPATTALRHRTYFNDVGSRINERPFYERKPQLDNLFSNENNKDISTDDDVQDNDEPEVFDNYANRKNVPLRKRRKGIFFKQI